MKIELRLFATLKKYENPEQAYTSDQEKLCPLEIIQALNIDPQEVKIIFINGLHADFNSTLHDGDRLGIFPPVGGG